MSRGENAAQPRRRYIASLDGLRALAVVAVIAYHLQIRFAQGGLLGVTVFFVLSGYLITGLLVNEFRESGTINLPQFWLRRVRRLFPAIVVVIAVVAALCVLFNHPLLTKMRPDIVPSLFWFQNWWYVFRGLSYFEALGDPSPLTHFWSLAIEEQFYVVWPLILLLVFKLGASNKIVRRICLILAAISAIWMGVLFDPHIDPTRVYYGTDTRASSLLIGAWLALFWPGQQLTEESTRGVPPRSIHILDAVGTVALVAVIIMMATVDGFSPFMYYGGIVLTSVLTAIVIATLVHPRSVLARVAALQPFVWIGKRSYAMYLWHYPIILLLKPLNNAQDGFAWWFILLVFALTFAVSALSYRFVEEPIRHGAIGQFIARVREEGFDTSSLRRVRVAVPSLACILVLGIAIVGCIAVPDTSSVPEDAIVSTGVAAGQAKDLSAEDATSGAPADDQANKPIGQEGQKPGDGDNAKGGSGKDDGGKDKFTPKELQFTSTGVFLSDAAIGLKQQAEAIEEQKKKEEAEREEKLKYRIPLLIGDSVPGDSEDAFNKRFPHGLMDAYIGRWFYQALDVYRGYEEQDAVGDVVVFANFSNFRLKASELDEMYELVGSDKQIFLVTSEMDESFEGEVNDTLVDFAEKYDNVHIIDWHAAVQDHMSEWLWDDRTHLTPDGAEAYQQLILDSIKDYLSEGFYTE